MVWEGPELVWEELQCSQNWSNLVWEEPDLVCGKAFIMDCELHGLGVKGKYYFMVVLMRKAGAIRGVYRTRSALPGKADLAYT